MTEEHHQVVVVGAGFGGLGTTIRLLQSGITDIVVLERGDDVGGVWRDNTYPGCACDVQAHLYSFSFAPNPDWGHMFAPQPEIYAYLRHCADAFGVRPHIRFDHTVQELGWEDAEQRWIVRTNRGVLSADHVVLAAGALAEPAVPELPGLDRFAGEAFHSARWNHDVELRGARVAVVGTGASAIQFVPAIQPEVAKVTVFQRTPPWIMPRHDRPVSQSEQERFRRFPLLQRLLRLRIYLERELYMVGFHHPDVMRVAERAARRHLESQVRDPELRRQLTPDYRLGCKRILLSNDYLAALDQPNADVVTSGITEVCRDGVIDGEGTVHRADVIIFGTGFQALEMPLTRHLHGREGATMSQTWGGSPRAYMGTTVAGFPNLYLIHGPNIGLGHTSVIHMIESQITYITQAIGYAERHSVAALEPARTAQAEWCEEVDAQGDGTVWTEGGCTSWYLDRTGRNSNLWPSYTFAYRRRSRRFDPEAHVLRPRTPAPVAVGG